MGEALRSGDPEDRAGARRRRPFWQSVSFRMTVGTALLLLVVLTAGHLWNLWSKLERASEAVVHDAELTGDLVLRSLESVTPGARPVHTGYLGDRLVELPHVHNIRMIAVNGTTVRSHHADEIGQRLEPTESVSCRTCHAAGGQTSGSRVIRSRTGVEVYHRGFAIENKASCRACHVHDRDSLGLLLISLEMTPYEKEAEHWQLALVFSALAALLAATVAISLLFRRLIRRPLYRLETEMQAVEQGYFDAMEEPQGRGEIADLHRSFQRTAGRLEVAQTRLKERVREGTEEISNLHEELDLVYSNLMHMEHLSAMGTLSARMAHEIRTPLNALALNLQLIERGLRAANDGDPQLLELTANVGNEVTRIGGILEQFMARVRKPQLDANCEPAGAIVESVVFLMTPEARRAGVELRLDVAAEARSLGMNGNLLRQVLLNLVSNAIAASPRGGEVVLRVAEDDGALFVAVDDAGPGISAELAERVFEPFFTTRADGTGLGLAIVHRLVADYGGTIAINKSAAGGASFRVRLTPCCRDAAEDAAGEP